MSASAVPLISDRAAALRTWVARGVLGAAEVHGAEVLLRGVAAAAPEVRLGAAFALWAPLHGHVCFDLARAAELVASARSLGDADDDDTPLPWPDTDAWIVALDATDAVRRVAGHEIEPLLDERPLVRFGTRLYTQRQWVDECSVAAQLRTRALRPVRPIGHAADAVLDAAWPNAITDDADAAQRTAASTAIAGSFTAVVGGPGSGKTFTVAGLLAAALAEDPTMRVALAAPTGKAAQRMRESIAAASPELGGIQPTTVHRLLGPLGSSRTRFRHDASNPLPHDLVVVDETSMIDLALMCRLLQALRADSRLVVIGDPDQLDSIAAGSILGDVVAAARDPQSPLGGRVVRLGRSRRQASGSLIAALADAVREGRVTDALDVLRAGREHITFVETEDPLSSAAAAVVRDVVQPSLSDTVAAASAGRTRAALRSVSSTRVLCAHRSGRAGADRWNAQIAAWAVGDARARRSFAGRPLLATRNDLRTGLSNGDGGVLVQLDGALVAAFEVGGDVRTFAPVQLENVETAFALTVHKSQGSEYDTVVLIVPPAASPLARRELLYTALTRARRRLVVVGSVDALGTMVRTPSERSTGLADALRSPSS